MKISKKKVQGGSRRVNKRNKRIRKQVKTPSVLQLVVERIFTCLLNCDGVKGIKSEAINSFERNRGKQNVEKRGIVEKR